MFALQCGMSDDLRPAKVLRKVSFSFRSTRLDRPTNSICVNESRPDFVKTHETVRFVFAFSKKTEESYSNHNRMCVFGNSMFKLYLSFILLLNQS